MVVLATLAMAGCNKNGDPAHDSVFTGRWVLDLEGESVLEEVITVQDILTIEKNGRLIEEFSGYGERDTTQMTWFADKDNFYMVYSDSEMMPEEVCDTICFEYTLVDNILELTQEGVTCIYRRN